MPPLNRNAGRTLDIGVFGARGIPSTYSGFETFLTVLLPELARRGHAVTMYRRPGIGTDGTTFRGVRCRTLPSVRTKQLDTLSHGFVCGLAAAIRRHDVVFVCNIANVPFVALVRQTGVPVVLNTDGQEWLRGKWGNTARSYFYWCARNAGRAATALVSDCNAMRDLYADEFGVDSTVIPYCWNGVLEDDDDDMSPSHTFAPGSYFVTGGRLVPENNIDLVAEAYAATRHEQSLAVVGEANYDSPVVRRLRELAEHDARIRPIGHVASRRGFRELLANARGYLHGHSVGGMNPSLVEAMASRAAVVALDTPFNRETLGPAAHFFTRDHADVQRVLQHLCDATAQELDAYRDRLRARALEHFDLGSVADAYEQLFVAVSEARRTSRTRLTTQWQVA
jgi:glycosyltransferase involved in cell wall biosynthesis